VLSVEWLESAATGCARAFNEFRTFIIQNSTLNIEHSTDQLGDAAEAFMSNAG